MAVRSGLPSYRPWSPPAAAPAAIPPPLPLLPRPDLRLHFVAFGLLLALACALLTCPPAYLMGAFFVAGQVFRFSGFVSDQGSLNATRTADEHYVIVTYWRSFEEHEKSHADKTFRDKFSALAALCTDTQELGYDMLWQGAPEGH